MTDLIQDAAVAAIAGDEDLRRETFKAALIAHSGSNKHTMFELRHVMRAIFQRAFEIYSVELSKAVPEAANDIQKQLTMILRQTLDAIDRRTDELMTVEQAADLVAVGKQSIRRWVQDKHVGDFNPTEKRYLVSRRRLRDYLRDRRGSVPDRV